MPLSGGALSIAVGTGYLAGSIPFGLLLSLLSGRGDVRVLGSGNIGATNVLRTGSRVLAAATLLLDIGKGAGAALLVSAWLGPTAALVAAAAAVVGHDFPIWLRFRGGKGVSTSLGVLGVLLWPAGLAACGVWLLVFARFRIPSLASLLALAVAPVVAVLTGASGEGVIATALLALLACIRHHANIRRLLRGEEPHFGDCTHARR